MSFDDALDVPPAKSLASTSATSSPSRAAWAATAAPTIPSSDDEQVEAPGRELLDRSIAGVHPWIVPQL